MRHLLIPHPRSPCDAVSCLEVEVGTAGAELTLRYVLTGDMSRIVVPPVTAPARVGGLWARTCFEAFVGGDGAAYAEFNLSPSTEWAAYRFDDYRQGMAPLAETQAPHIATTVGKGLLEMRVSLARPAGSRLGLTAVIEEVGGRLSYWALRHPTAQPDFHHPDGFVLAM
ncbi:MAG: DOMON-like domain-containing protein [Alphaproteobacteria bacterium]|nr:DOMON-like domain-containing protein [Alphaproteobacteria bacterium]MBU1514683.1 DOMON-like domain-containing protein [Alphaproteobacteria bacterium]MBU2093542.1 DOMON-like domain-containing protein [Alphaproteobacteria bacterium]MBU2149456.1 DOMON-like domain-containing protein [Alphaproteobacteria bacterium]MBU2305501.1 DOMON-like domain-containing protein [Alphaproteobacteria bacterium]